MNFGDHIACRAEGRVVQRRKVLLHRPACGLSIALLVPLLARDRPLLVGVRHDQAGIDREALAADEACRDARLHHPFEHAPEDVAIAEALVASARECRVIRDLVLDAQAAEPPVRHVHLHLAAQQPLRADGEHVAEDKHPDHENRINRGAAKVGVVGRQLAVHPRQVQHGSDLAHAMIARDDVLKAERIEQLPLVVLEPPHHRQPPLPRRLARRESRFAAHGNRLPQQNLPVAASRGTRRERRRGACKGLRFASRDNRQAATATE